MGECSSADRILVIAIVTCLTLQHYADRLGSNPKCRAGILIDFGSSRKLFGAGKAHFIVGDADQLTILLVSSSVLMALLTTER